jgi:hypothetical protein
LVTITVSAAFSAAMSFANCGRLAFTPLIFSRKIVVAIISMI